MNFKMFGQKKKNSLKDDKNRTRKKEKKKNRGVVWVTREMAEVLGREFILLTTLKDTLYFLIFCIIATIVNLGMINSSNYYLHRVMNEQLLVKNGFEEISTASDVWRYLDDLFTNSFYWDYWYYPDYEIKKTSRQDRNLFYENKLLGVPRLRQLKVRNNSCPIHYYFKRTFLSCYGHFSRSTENTDSFGLKEGTAWTHHTDTELGTSGYWGLIDWYHGGGFYEDLSLKKNETTEILNNLKKNLWITRETRAILLDFSVYNTNVNLFCIIRAAFEFPPTGGVITSSKIMIVKLLRYSTIYDFFILTCELVLLAYFIYYTMEEVREMIYFKLFYLKKFWSYIDMGIIILGVVALGLAVYRSVGVAKRLDRIMDNPNKYSNLDFLAILEVNYCNILAVQLFLIYLKVFKYLNFNRSMAQLNNTLSKCRKDMMGFGLMFFVIFIAFAVLGYLLFGTEVDDFSSFYLAIFTLLRTILGDFNYTEIERANRILAPIFFLCFIFLVFFVLLNMFLAIINDTYTDVKTEIAIAPEELQMAGFLKRGYYNMLIKLGCKRFVKASRLQKNEFEMTTNEIKGALKRIGFSDLEVEMFFARYNIDSSAEVSDYDVQKLLDALEGNVDPAPPPTESRKKQDDFGRPLVAIDDFLKQQERLDEIEFMILKATRALNDLLGRLEELENVRKTAIPTKQEDQIQE